VSVAPPDTLLMALSDTALFHVEPIARTGDEHRAFMAFMALVFVCVILWILKEAAKEPLNPE
jgi:hypothetical protein